MASQSLVIPKDPGVDYFTTALAVQGRFNLSISGTFVATVHYQRSFNGGSTWRDVATWTEAVETTVNEPEPCLVRIGVKNGNFTSGTIGLRLGR